MAGVDRHFGSDPGYRANRDFYADRLQRIAAGTRQADGVPYTIDQAVALVGGDLANRRANAQAVAREKAGATPYAPTPPPVPPTDDDLARRANALPFDLTQAVARVRHGLPSIDVDRMPYGPDAGLPGTMRTEHAMGLLGQRLGLMHDAGPVSYQDVPGQGPLKVGWRDPHDAAVLANLMDPRSATFGRVAGLIRRGGGQGLGMTPYGAALSQGPVTGDLATTLGAPFSSQAAAIVKNDPGIGDATTGGLWMRALGTGTSPTRAARTLLGDPRADSELSGTEGGLEAAADFLLFGGLSSAAERGGAALAGLGARAGRGAADAGLGDWLARRQVVGALADEMGKAATGSAMRSGLSAVARRAGAMTAETVGVQALPTLARAADLAARHGTSFGGNLPQAAVEGAQGLASLYDPRTVFDPTKTPYERAQSALAIGTAGLGGYGLAADGLRKGLPAGIVPPTQSHASSSLPTNPEEVSPNSPYPVSALFQGVRRTAESQSIGLANTTRRGLPIDIGGLDETQYRSLLDRAPRPIRDAVALHLANGDPASARNTLEGWARFQNALQAPPAPVPGIQSETGIQPYVPFDPNAPDMLAAAIKAARRPVSAELPWDGESYLSLRGLAREWLRSRQARNSTGRPFLMETPALGTHVAITRESIDKIGGKTPVGLRMVPLIPDLLKNAEFVRWETAKRGHANMTAAWLVAKLETSEGAHRVYMLVRRGPNGDFYYDHAYTPEGPSGLRYGIAP